VPVLLDIATLVTGRMPRGPGHLDLVRDAAIAWQGDRIAWVGPAGELPAVFAREERYSAGGGLVIPGLVDCHTHLAFGGWRADEFEARIRGETYLEIAARGGGIRSTVAQTRAATREELRERCNDHLARMARLGVTTVEAKSGYGLTLEHELGLLELYRELREGGAQRIVATLLAAHVVPPEFQDRRADYVELVTGQLIPQVGARALAQFCDAFVEEGAFSIPEARRILLAGQAHGLLPKLHADQLTSGGGAELAAEVGAASADHLECISDAGVRQMAAAGVVAVSLPFASLYLGVAPLPARRLLAAGVPVAVATDFNPGSAPSYHLPVALTLACTMQRMTPAEVLHGATAVAARALALGGVTGSVVPGLSADFAVLEAESVNHWLYHLRENACVLTVARGQVVWRATA
jgi:imidazolonepropionase